MKRSDLTILVTGGTGHQGGAAARHILADGWRVRALVRDPDKAASRALAEAGCELVVGDLLDRDSLDRAVDGCHGAYSVQTPAGVGEDGEVREGINLVDAAVAAGVEQFVYSSVIGADLEHGSSYQRPKHRIEAHILDVGIPATIWRPVSFMENFLWKKADILAGRLTDPVAPDVVRQFIAVDDIGKFVALAFREHDRFVGVTAEIASDEKTMPEVAALFALALDLPVEYEEVAPPEGMPSVRNPGPGEVPPRRADLEELHLLIPDLWSLERWIATLGW